jgi:ubiquinone/menaquinone biosynthesis C-methylase UbiE
MIIWDYLFGSMCLLQKSTFKQLEREYWNRRGEIEGNATQLQRRYENTNIFEDPWGILNYLKLVAKEPAGSRVLEVGAGLGSQAIPLALSCGYYATITDISTSCMVANQQAILNTPTTTDINFSVADADSLPFPDASFDIVMTHATLHHLPVPGRTVQEMVRCLRPGGLLVLGHEPNRLIFGPLRWVADKIHITEKHTQRFVSGCYSVADEETPGFRKKELYRWVKENNLEIEWLTPIWFVNAFFYNLPVLTNIIFKQKLSVSEKIVRFGQVIDERFFASLPLVQNMGLFWSLGARKKS